MIFKGHLKINLKNLWQPTTKELHFEDLRAVNSWNWSKRSALALKISRKINRDDDHEYLSQERLD